LSDEIFIVQQYPPLGDLEAEVMTVMWLCAGGTVKDVAAKLQRARAYNTVQTTLDRLHRKLLLRREKRGHAFFYTAAMDRATYHRGLLASVVGDLLPQQREPLLAAFVEIAAADDVKNLERLQSLIDAKRAGEPTAQTWSARSRSGRK
jgi:predicted transcriptional regulator